MRPTLPLKQWIFIVFALATELSGCLLMASTSAGSKNPPIGKSSPNVVLIIIDTLRADKLGCYRSPLKDISPEIDEMAKHGVLFENAFSQCSWTRPSIGSLVTARYPRSIGIFKEKFDMLQKADFTLAEILQQNGYRTFGITANPNINRLFNFHQGFDEYRDTNVVTGIGWHQQMIFSRTSVIRISHSPNATRYSMRY